MTSVEIIEPLSAADRRDYQLYKGRIRIGFKDGIEAIQQIRDRRLYREEFGTFEDFCQTELSYTRQYINRLIKAEEANENLETIVSIEHESWMRVLSKAITPEQKRDALAVAYATAPEHKVTAQWLDATIDVLKVAGGTNGYVDTGDGEMTPLTAAITQEVSERQARKRQYIADDSKWERVATVEMVAIELMSVTQLNGQLANLGDYDPIKVTVYKEKRIDTATP